MKALATARIALRELRRNRMRSALTALGVIIGVGTILAMMGIGSGAKAQIEAQVASLGENVIMIYPGSISSHSGVRLGWGSSATLTVEDAEAIEREIPEAIAVSPEVYTYSQATAGNQNWNTKVYGEAPVYFDIRQWPLAEGEIFTDSDLSGRSPVAVIGLTASRQLFGDGSPVDQIVRIQNVPFRVIGLLSAKGFSVRGHDQDNVVIVPYTSVLGRLMGKSSALYAINIQAADTSVLPDVQEAISGLLRQRHRIARGKEDDFIVRNQEEIAETATETTRIMTLLLGAIAGVSLVVGGIGIMNTMLVSVSERTREIGLRMAVGARGADILRQFLVEALTLSCIGGGIGIVLGIGTSKALTAFADWPTLISVRSIVVAFLFSAAVGIFFGLYPARKASHLDPIEALRYE